MTDLFLDYNMLITLPAEIGKLTNLTLLDLSDNSLTTLPVEMLNLKSLTILELFFNNFTDQQKAEYKDNFSYVNDLNL